MGDEENFGLPDIGAEERRFQDIVKGKIKQHLGKYLTKPGVLVPGENNKKYKFTIPEIDLPRFRFGSGQGAGQGSGGKGDSLGPGQPGDEPGEGDEAGDQPGEHGLEVDVTLEELVEWMSEEWELPNIQPKGKKNIESEDFHLHGLRRTGPRAMMSRRRTFKEAYFREIATGRAKPGQQMGFYPIKRDRRFRSWTYEPQPVESALIFFLRDYSGSMDDKKTTLLRTTDWILDLWLSAYYKGVERVYILHDTEAKVVSQEEYYKTSVNGGTEISSGYAKVLELLEKDYDPTDWNVYLFQGTDGDNYNSDNDNALSLAEKLLPSLNLLALNVIQPGGHGGGFREVFLGRFGAEHKVMRTALTTSDDDIEQTIKSFLKRKS